MRSREEWCFDWDEGSRGSSQLAGREWGGKWQNHEARFGLVELVLEGVQETSGDGSELGSDSDKSRYFYLGELRV